CTWTCRRARRRRASDRTMEREDSMCCKGGKLLLGIVALGLVVGGGITAYFLLREPPPEERPAPAPPRADKPDDPWSDFELKDENDARYGRYRQLYYSQASFHVPLLMKKPYSGTSLGVNYVKPADPRDWGR